MRPLVKNIISGTVTTAAIAASGAILTPYLAHAQVSGEYRGVKLPYAAGQARLVIGTHDSNRRAIDFGMKLENVLAIKDGKVNLVTKDQYGGKYILVDHGDGYCALYLHLDSFKVKQNDIVKQGQIIGISGNTGLGGKYHLHLAVIQKLKSNDACNTDNKREIAMLFDEKPNATLKINETIISNNGGSSTSSLVFQSPLSKLTVSVPSVDLSVQAQNLSGRTVYWQMYRPSVGNLTPRTWSGNMTATSNSLTLGDLDGTGDTLQGVYYYTVVSLSPIANGEAAKMRTSCFATSGGTQLCDSAKR